MGEPKNVQYRFGLKGLITQGDGELLQDGQYRSMLNMDALQEGLLYSRTGRRFIGQMPANNPNCTRIQKMVRVAPPVEDPAFPVANPRYLGCTDLTGPGAYGLWRTPTPPLPAGPGAYQTGTFLKVAGNISNDILTHRFSLAAYSTGNSGVAWAYIASQNKMLKDNGLNPYTVPLPSGDVLQQWGILPAIGVALVDLSGTAGGQDSMSPGLGATPYDYRYTYHSGDANNEGNPSQTMNNSDAPLNAHPGFGPDGILWVRAGDGQDRYHTIDLASQAVNIVCYISTDPQITTINIYRRGGILFDAWRLVGSIPNVEDPGHPGTGIAAPFTDGAADADIVFQKLLELDNDPPVPSTPPRPISGLANAFTFAGVQTITATVAGQFAMVTPGSVAHIEFDEAPEDVTVISATANQITAFFQYHHPFSTLVVVDAICGQPCPLAITYGQFVLVAGDPNNPHLIYRSKGDQPESFALLPLDGSVAVASCGTPSNPIMNFCEFRGQILTLNLSGLFETAIINGSLAQPSAQVSTRGMVSRFAWCKTETEVWFVSSDGVYSWDGGSVRKRSIAIDNLFRGQIYNRMNPIDLSAVGTQNMQMEYFRGEVYLIYLAQPDSTPRVLKCNPGFEDRWSPHDMNFNQDGALKCDCLYTETDTGSLIWSRHDPNGTVFSMVDTVRLHHLPDLNYTNDEYVGDPTTSGGGIFFNCALPWFDLGAPALMKTVNEAWLEVFCHVGSSLTVQIFVDYDEYNPVDTFTIPVQTESWTLVPLLPNTFNVFGHNSGFGRECRAITFFISGQTGYRQIAFRSLNFLYQETGIITGGGPRDWNDIGHKYDKRLYQMTVEFDTRGIGQTLILDSMRGKGGSTLVLGDAAGLTFPLTNPVIAGPGRAKQTFPIPDSTIVKLVRLRSIAAASNPPNPGFRIIDVQFEKEDYPPDIVSVTPWEDGGYEYLKYCNQVDVEVNTGGVDVVTQLQGDGVVYATFTINATDINRRRNLALPNNPSGARKWRLFTDPNQANIASGVGMFQLFSHRLAFQKADPGEIAVMEDWKDDGYKWDKRLQVLTIEWDASDDIPNTNVMFTLDIIRGVDGNFVSLDILRFDLATTGLFGLGRHQKAFPVPIGFVVKKYRLRPITTLPVQFRSWSYSVAYEKFPADVVLFTEPKDFGYEYDKEGQVVTLMIDTNGTPCVVHVTSDPGIPTRSLNTFTITTNTDDWRRELPLPPNQVGRLWQLTFEPGAGGKSQLFSWDLQFIKNPPYRLSFTEWENGGSEYEKYANQLDMDVNTNGIQVFFQVQADGVNAGPPILVATTYTDRRRNFTLPPNLVGKEWRIFCDLTQTGIAVNGGWFELFSHRFVFQPADKGDVGHSFDWQDLDHPYDKRLHVMTAEWNNVGGADVVMQMDMLIGIDGGNIVPSVMTFDLGANSGRHQRTFPLNDGLICKKVKVYPQGTTLPLFLRTWQYKMDFEKFPADIVYFTEPQDFGWPYDKIGRNLVIRIDTGNVPCIVQPIVDAVAAGPPLTITTSLDDWQRIIPLQSNPNLIGKLWKLHLTPGANGKAQLFQWNLDYVKEPPAVTSWDSFEQAFGYAGWKVMKEIFIQYSCESPLTMTWESDTGILQVLLPAHPVSANDNFRDAERYLFPSSVGWTGNTTAYAWGFNKSKVYTVHFRAATPFKLYSDASGILWFAIGQDRHVAYNTTLLSEFMTIPIGTT